MVSTHLTLVHMLNVCFFFLHFVRIFMFEWKFSKPFNSEKLLLFHEKCAKIKITAETKLKNKLHDECVSNLCTDYMMSNYEVKCTAMKRETNLPSWVKPYVWNLRSKTRSNWRDREIHLCGAVQSSIECFRLWISISAHFNTNQTILWLSFYCISTELAAVCSSIFIVIAHKLFLFALINAIYLVNGCLPCETVNRFARKIEKKRNFLHTWFQWATN